MQGASTLELPVMAVSSTSRGLKTRALKEEDEEDENACRR